MLHLNALVVDDSGIMRKMVMRTLTDSDLATFDFMEAGDGKEALEMFDPDTIDILFVDWNMPNMNGLEFIKAVRQTHKSRVPAVMITTEGTLDKIDEATDEGQIDGYIIKPFTKEAMQKKLGGLFERLEESKKPQGSFFGRLADKLMK